MTAAGAPPGADVAVIGGGIIGLAVAWRVAQRGAAVTVIEPDPARGASQVAAGMLAPVSEAHWGEEGHFAFNQASAVRWPAFAAELEVASGLPVGFSASGTLVVGLDGDDAAMVGDLAELHGRLDLAATRLRGRECRREEPLLAPLVRGGILVPGDHRVDPRAVTVALDVAAARAGVAVVADEAVEVTTAAGRATGVQLASGAHLAASTVVVAAGAWTSLLGGLPPGTLPPVRPVKGQLLVLAPRSADLRLRRTVRGWVHGSTTYLVPRNDGRIIVGATQEDQGFDTAVTGGALHDLLRDAIDLVPALWEHELVEAIAGLRPATPDNAPAIGPAAGLEGVVVATGHHRNGVLLTPITADVVASALASGVWSQLVSGLGPDRFATVFDRARVEGEGA